VRVHIGCEYSGRVREAFRKRGHFAVSVDLLPSEDNSPYHVQGDLLEYLKREPFDLAIFHPPCTHLAVSGARHFAAKRADGRQQAALDFVGKLMDCGVKQWALENPVSIISSHFRKPDQIIQPWQFGHPEKKATCLWLHNLPCLTPTNDVSALMATLPKSESERVHRMPPSPDRWKERSRTFQGVADAMAAQWG